MQPIEMIDNFIEPVRCESEEKDQLVVADAKERMFCIRGYKGLMHQSSGMLRNLLMSNTRNR